MIRRVLAGVLACCLWSGLALAGPEHPEHQPEPTGQKTGNPGVSRGGSTSKLAIKSKTSSVESVQPELSNIVVLCATEQEEEFEKEWRQYVNKKGLKGAELKETIAWVSEEAAMRREQQKGAASDAKLDEEWMEQRRRFMSEVADKALNPVR